MSRLTLTTIAVAAAIIGNGVLAQCPAAGQVVCQTSSGSPDVSDCTTVASEGSNPGGVGCGQAYGSGCYTDVTVGACSGVLCQNDGTSPVCLAQASCEGTYWQMLLDQCQSNGKVGGYVNVPDADGSGNYLNFEFTT